MVRREDRGKREAKSTYSPFMMAVDAAFVRWLSRDGCRKLELKDVTWVGSETSRELEVECKLEGE